MNRAVSGRPVRFFGLLMLGWFMARLMSIGSGAGEQEDGRPVLPQRRLPRVRSLAIKTPLPEIVRMGKREASLSSGKAIPVRSAASIGKRALQSSPHAASRTGAEVPARQAYMPPAPDPLAGSGIAGTTAIPLTIKSGNRHDRWHGSGWILWREGSSSRATAIAGGKLGGSQAGLRLDRDLTPSAASRTSAYGRVSSAVNRPESPEGALGIAWQPKRSIPVSIAAERRIALGKGARNANAVLAVGGFGPTSISGPLQAEGYAQAGMVGFARKDLFVDGKASLLSRIGRSPVRIGAGLSGGAQPEVERLDLGPELQIRLPLPHLATRLGVEWRTRIAGQATPPSGLAITLGTDF